MSSQFTQPVALLTKLHKLRQEIPTLLKESTANGGKYSWDYIDLPTLQKTINPYLDEAGVFYYWTTTVTDELPCIVLHVVDIESGGCIESRMLLGDEVEKFQETGKQLTYYSRYLLMLALGLVAEKDNDGAPSSTHKSKRSINSKGRTQQQRRRQPEPDYLDDDEYDEIPFDEEEDDDIQDEPLPQRRRSNLQQRARR